ncbi:SF1B family DNA helicase RecD2 [Clostridium intestinale]|uniref:ATP-dependent RecD2 DNA helicase n=2 Tax=Clostridium intestinale TaxID=36845 RepID=U2NSI6_9CLOT|nr:ATP-dependent RecD-like DNA helicase [Clostridium intestinale]ERK32133.1 recombinase D [Clostridium intestinale URNW]QLY79216.1 ATP-dependent RecD-like DNA helicase [Clostridium intestinale]
MEEISGIIESIVFHNEENGYMVAKLSNGEKSFTAVGVVPFIKEGIHLKIKGEWVLHPSFGRQIKIEECEEIIPNTLEGIEKYLSSGVIYGIGPITAKKIIDKFKENTLDILDKDINKLREIEGIGEKKFLLIKESYEEQKELKNIIIFFQTHGVTTNQCIKIYKRFGTDSINIVKENPYILCEEITGIGFKTADKIARSIGIEKDSPYRIESGIKYVINQFCANGNTYMPVEILIKEGIEVLTVSKQVIEENLYNACREQKLILEKVNEDNGVFTLPYYYCEIGITKRILTLSVANFQKFNTDIEYEISMFENKNDIKFAASQKKAILGAFNNGIEIITGGPGTGKTTIIKCIINIFEKSGNRVILAAPTGRAAKRMSESTGKEAKTIHRLLEMGVTDSEEKSIFGKDEGSPLEADVVIIDEASMIDVMLMNSLLKAIRVGTRVILVGDVDQLPSVGPGNVLKDLIESGFTEVIRLKEIFRQGKESLIVVNAHKINEGTMPILNERDKDFFFIKEDNLDYIMTTLIDLINNRLPKFNASWDKMKHLQILTPMKKGNLGVTNLNYRLQEILNPPSDNKREKKIRDNIFRVGDKVMQTKNNYTLKWKRIAGYGEPEGVGVFNGDMGFIESINEEEKIFTIIFDDERKVIYDFIYLDELDLAYAITIHKSQGSEFPVIITPAYMGSPMLMNRNLLYTGITRAKQLVVVVGSIKALKFMIENTRSTERYSSLKFRIKDIISSDAFN